MCRPDAHADGRRKRFLIADVSPIVVAALVDLVSDFANAQVVASCDDQRSLIELARVHLPDFVVIDSAMLGDRLNVGPQLARHCPDAVIVATAVECSAALKSQLEAAGAHLCVEKGRLGRELPRLMANHKAD
jgi:DNA-binding NarL/FixJ family response regulator